MARYMVIETFHEGALDKVYERFHAQGRLLPEGLHYVDSWLTQDKSRCFQLMETEDEGLFEVWITRWKDVTAFEVVLLGEKPGED